LEGRDSRKPIVGAHPECDDDKGEGRNKEKSVLGARLEEEQAWEGQIGADKVGKLKGGPDQDEVSEGEQGP